MPVGEWFDKLLPLLHWIWRFSRFEHFHVTEIKSLIVMTFISDLVWIPRSSAFCIRLNFEAQDFSVDWIDVEVEDSSVQLNGKAVVRLFGQSFRTRPGGIPKCRLNTRPK